MRIRDLRTFSGSDEVNRLQDNLVDCLEPIIGAPLSNHALLTDIILTTTATPVAHKLGYKPRGWIIAGKNAAQDIYEVSKNKTTLTLQASGTVTVSLVVF